MASSIQTIAALVEVGLSYTTNLKIYSKKAAKNPAWLIMFIFSRFGWVRSIARLRLRPLDNPVSNAGGASVFQEIAIDDAVSDLETQGHTPCFKLDSERLAAVRRCLSDKVCYAPGDPSIAFEVGNRERVQATNGRAIGIARYFKEDLADPVIDDIAKDPLILSIARRYFNAEPVHVKTRVFWSFPLEPHQRPSGRHQKTQAFHFDTDDYQAMRLFIYLTDVDDGTGPHVCVSGSHRRKRFWHLVSPFRQKSNQAIAEGYGRQAIHTVTGSAGSGFLEDPFCFHKAPLPVTTSRLLMMVRYAVRDYGFYPLPLRQQDRRE